MWKKEEMSVVSEYLDRMNRIFRSNYNPSLKTDCNTVWVDKISFLISFLTEFVPKLSPIRVHTDRVRLHISDNNVVRFIENESTRYIQLIGYTTRNHLSNQLMRVRVERYTIITIRLYYNLFRS